MGTKINLAEIRFRRNSYVARLAAWLMRSPSCALVIGRTIHLHGANETDLKNNQAWLNHELAHVAQYQRYGILNFLIRYGWYSLRYGYYNNPFEIEARGAERRSI